MGKKKTGYADFTFAFGATLQKLAESRIPPTTVESFRVEPTRLNSGSYDTLVVTFRVPRADEDRPQEPLEKLTQDVETSIKEMGVNTNEI